MNAIILEATTINQYAVSAQFAPKYSALALSNASYKETADEELDIQLPTTDSIVAIALSNECVIGARAFEWQGGIVVAILTTPFYLKSERDIARQTILDSLIEDSGYENILVTFDVEIYRNTSSEMSDVSKQRLFELTLNRM